MSRRSPDEWQLLGRRLEGGSPEAFGDLLLFLEEMLGNPPAGIDAHAIVLDAAQRIQGRLRRGPSAVIASLAAYCRRVLARCRTSRRDPAGAQLGLPLENLLVDRHAVAPERMLHAREVVRSLVVALESLGAEERQLILLVDARGWSVPQVTAQWRETGRPGMSVRAVESRLRRARERFRDLLVAADVFADTDGHAPQTQRILTVALRELMDENPNASAMLISGL